MGKFQQIFCIGLNVWVACFIFKADGGSTDGSDERRQHKLQQKLQMQCVSWLQGMRMKRNRSS